MSEEKKPPAKRASKKKPTREEINLAIWNYGRTPDPAFVKTVNTRGGFKTVDAYWRIREATKIFGPIGKGWGWEITQPIQWVPHSSGATVVIQLELWWVDTAGERYAFPLVNAAKWTTKNGVDEDALKKVVTDTVTKGLSLLGFGADIHMGMFDDPRYVDGARQHFAEKQQQQRQQARQQQQQQPAPAGTGRPF